MARFDSALVRTYYEANTPAFVAFGQGGGEGAIHRAVWGPGVQTRAQAFHFVDDRLAELVGAAGAHGRVPHVVDLGCGVGASLCYLAERVAMTGTGVTLSPAQVSLARARLTHFDLDARVSCVEADFADLPPTVPAADVAFAIEAFVHAADPERFFAQCARLVRPAGRLVICDDVRRDPAPSDRQRAAAAVDRFCRGWHVNTLITTGQLRALAAAAGFLHEATTDLTPWLELRRPRDRALALLAGPLDWLGRGSPRLASLAGGAALNQCLRRGWIAYELSGFRRAS